MYHAICSDRGTVKKINQDSALYKQASTGNGDLGSVTGRLPVAR